ncbi:hypothetical protein ACQ858_20580 [Variovorax ureilyticus]|uniref:hypothetical protein n=1 Tax=Variovorax ureilyticus TaxID=1836198 RepID=UPI003D666CBD
MVKRSAAPAGSVTPSKVKTTRTALPTSGVPSTRYWIATPDPLDFMGADFIGGAPTWLLAGDDFATPSALAHAGTSSASADSAAAAMPNLVVTWDGFI